MTLTKEQFERLYKKGLTVEQIKAFDSGQTPATMQPKKPDGFVANLVKDPIQTLVVKPALRFGQALGAPIAKALGATDAGIGRAASQDVTIKSPLGDFNVEAQKGFGEGGGRQIAGDTAKVASYLYTGGTGPAAVSSGLKGEVMRGAAQGFKTGAVGGGLYSFGQAVQEAEAQAPEVAYKTLFGAAVGGALGLTLGAATPIVVKTANQVRRFSNVEAINEELYKLNNTVLRPTPKQSQTWAEQGVDPVKTYSEIFATEVPKVDKNNRFIPESAQEFADKVDTLYKSGAEGFNTILRNSPETNSLGELEQATLSRNQSSNLTALQKQQAEVKILGEFQALRREYAQQLIDGDRLPVYVSDSIKDRYWGATKYFGPEEASVSNEANRAIARSFAEGIENVITDVNVKNYNKELQKLIVLRDYLGGLGGKLAGTGGKATRLMSRIVGGIAGSSGGPSGAVIGSITGDKVAQVLMNPENSPMRWLILKRLEALPKVERQNILNEANDIIQQMIQRKEEMLQLPAGAIPLGSKTQTDSIKVIQADKVKAVSSVKATPTVKAEDPLLTEARKYKSAEEFVKAKTNAYHGTSEDFTEFRLQNGRNLGPNAVFVSPQNEVASYYAQGIGKGGKGKVIGVNLSDANLFDYNNKQHLSKISDFIDRNYLELAEKMRLNTEYATKDYLKNAISDGDYTYLEEPTIQKFIKDSGFDGFKIRDYTGGDGVGIFDVSKLKTESQLTDIWKKANKKP